MTDRRTLSPRAAYYLAAAVIGLGLFASATPSPLYATYSEIWHFSPVTLTLVFATYAFGVLVALLAAGGLSDDVGRRPVLLVSLGAAILSTVLFIVADSVAWLYAARATQGLANGVLISAASAALLDLHPRRNPADAGLATAVVAAGGLGLGTLVSSLLVAVGWEPRVLPYVALLLLFAAAFVATWWLPESVSERRRLRLAFERPHVPATVRRPYTLAGLAVLSSWSIGGLFFSLGPELADRLFSTTNVVVSGSGIVALAGAAVVSQVLTARTPPWLAASAGSIALAGGMVLIIVADLASSGTLFVAGSLLGGVGFGAAFLGGLRALVAAIPPEHRAAVMSAFYLAAYGSLSVPAVIAGVVVTHIGLQSTFEIFGGVVGGIALVVAAEAWRSRPRRMLIRQELVHAEA
jgi:MFS family permease